MRPLFFNTRYRKTGIDSWWSLINNYNTYESKNEFPCSQVPVAKLSRTKGEKQTKEKYLTKLPVIAIERFWSNFIKSVWCPLLKKICIKGLLYVNWEYSAALPSRNYCHTLQQKWLNRLKHRKEIMPRFWPIVSQGQTKVNIIWRMSRR